MRHRLHGAMRASGGILWCTAQGRVTGRDEYVDAMEYMNVYSKIIGMLADIDMMVL